MLECLNALEQIISRTMLECLNALEQIISRTKHTFPVDTLYVKIRKFSCCENVSFREVRLSLLDHVPDWQPCILLGMVEARSVNVKKTTTTMSLIAVQHNKYVRRSRVAASI